MTEALLNYPQSFFGGHNNQNVTQDIELKCGNGNTGSKVATSNDNESDNEERGVTKSSGSAVRHIRCKTSSPTSVTVATVIDRY